MSAQTEQYSCRRVRKSVPPKGRYRTSTETPRTASAADDADALTRVAVGRRVVAPAIGDSRDRIDAKGAVVVGLVGARGTWLMRGLGSGNRFDRCLVVGFVER